MKDLEGLVVDIVGGLVDPVDKVTVTYQVQDHRQAHQAQVKPNVQRIR